ncbi:endolytic transglycosylase MltG [Thalassotalea sp. HSM 43]|uniref:endolytic transglycosylase MltG n=1 Tax=Thalassotalea sp. HSM 43 TaxID=2552945 RepID=UPI001080F545|nr:endolytic transglycosylase MltG [Thalassotalea sp. HSM 43]QBY05797.1 endolytic transglycosylase MltG [Thalassotalea sp. HSM 43]
MLQRILLIFIVLGLLAAGGMYAYVDAQLQKPINISQQTLYQLNKGKSYHHLVKDFNDKGWLTSTLPFRVYAKLYPAKTNVKSGSYLLDADMNMLDIITLMNSGKEAQFKLTFVEGTTFKQWLLQLSETPHIKQTLQDKSQQQVLSLITEQYTHPEGLFFPDTYQYTASMSDIDILRNAHQRMMQELDDSWQGRAKKLPYKNVYEALIMASLIEKETGKLSEQPLIASVFISRLNKGMRLQTDPTIIYGLGDRYTGDITYANIREKTAYNTYRINGLPPTPIAMPGKSAIEASMHPAQSQYLYFVSKGNGEHYFSKTLQEHNKAVDKYIRGK